jgi:ArsR family transcriptional regulator
MKIAVTKRHEGKAVMLKALAHPARVMIAEAVSARRICVCELTGMAGLDISSVSRHLSVLKNAGIVGVEREGNKIYYSLRRPCVAKFLKCLDGVC